MTLGGVHNWDEPHQEPNLVLRMGFLCMRPQFLHAWSIYHKYIGIPISIACHQNQMWFMSIWNGVDCTTEEKEEMAEMSSSEAIVI